MEHRRFTEVNRCMLMILQTMILLVIFMSKILFLSAFLFNVSVTGDLLEQPFHP